MESTAKPAPFQIAVGSLSILLGFSFPLREVLDLLPMSILSFQGSMTFGRAAFLIDSAWTAVLGASLIWCGWMFLRNRPWGPWTAALCGGAVLIDSLYLFVDLAPLFTRSLLLTAGTKYVSLTLWAVVWLLLLTSRLVWALGILGISLSLRGRSAFPKAQPEIRPSTLWTTAIVAGVVAAGARLMTLAIGWVALT